MYRSIFNDDEMEYPWPGRLEIGSDDRVARHDQTFIMLDDVARLEEAELQ
ncbi:hypothetical protein HYG81_18685 [Natrinema zhouii]|nr:hypothetical protein [Natrinema zhouii]UHQ97962.1 hypothetical protein HYG81_18685 [Natrinema zhouii]